MEKSSLTSPVSRTPSALLGEPETVDALSRIGAMLHAAAVCQHLMESQIFPLIPLADSKAAASHERTLMAPSSLPVLALVWKESAHVSDADRATTGLGTANEKGNPLNIYSIAKGLSCGAADLARQQKRVETIIEAAEAYGLVVREQANARGCRQLSGTDMLHQFILALSAKLGPIFADAALSSGDM